MRNELLTRYLKENERPLSEVSALLGFANPSAFSRWHRITYGVTAASRQEKVSSLIEK